MSILDEIKAEARALRSSKKLQDIIMDQMPAPNIDWAVAVVLDCLLQTRESEGMLLGFVRETQWNIVKANLDKLVRAGKLERAQGIGDNNRPANTYNRTPIHHG